MRGALRARDHVGRAEVEAPRRGTGLARRRAMASHALCAACGGFVVDPAAPCLHCDAAPRPLRRLMRFLATALLGVGATMTLMACYGAMPPQDDCVYGGWCPDAAQAPPDSGRIGDAAVTPDAAAPDAPPDPCAGLDPPTCDATDGCAAVITGVDCTSSGGGTCTPDDCHCESYEYSCASVPAPP
jgi:hypothetical protein